MEFEGINSINKENALKLNLWMYAHNGATLQAIELMKKQNVLWSDKNDLDALLKEVGLRKLSDIMR